MITFNHRLGSIMPRHIARFLSDDINVIGVARILSEVHFSSQSWPPFLLVALKRGALFFLKKLMTFLVVAYKKTV